MTRVDREYAEALFALALEEGKSEEYLTSLREISEFILEEPLYLQFLSSPAISLAERLDAIDQAFGATYDEYLVSFLKLLCENGRMESLSACVLEYEKLLRTVLDRAVANVSSAVELDEAQKQALMQKMESVTGKKLDPVYTVCPELIAGVCVEIEGKTYDGTLLRKLREVKDVMSR